jgi:hypothetical protein
MGMYFRTPRQTDVNWLDRQPLLIFVIAALTLGLAPFVPEPHLWEKLRMLMAGSLSRPLDIFDLLLHAAPWALLLLKLYRQTLAKPPTA